MNINLNTNGILQLKSLERAPSTEPTPEVTPAGDDGWKVMEGGVNSLKGMHGDMEVSDEALRRDDPLGLLVDRAFDPAAAVQFLRGLPIT